MSCLLSTTFRSWENKEEKWALALKSDDTPEKNIVWSIHELLLMTRPLGQKTLSCLLTTTFRSWDDKTEEWALALKYSFSQIKR